MMSFYKIEVTRVVHSTICIEAPEWYDIVYDDVEQAANKLADYKWEHDHYEYRHLQEISATESRLCVVHKAEIDS